MLVTSQYCGRELFKDRLQIRVNKAFYCPDSITDRLSCVIYPWQYQGIGEKAGVEQGEKHLRHAKKNLPYRNAVVFKTAIIRKLQTFPPCLSSFGRFVYCNIKNA